MPDYRISGLSVRSEFELPGAVPKDVLGIVPDVSVRRGSLPRFLSGVTASGLNWEMTGEAFWFQVPDVAHFTIVRGREIIVDLEQDAREHDAAGFVLGTALGIVLHQRSALVLHGAAVAKDGRAIAICGASGTGKSTLAAALCRAGCSFVADDICVINPDDRRQPVVLPDGRRLKLWADSIDRLALEGRKAGVVREGWEKYFIEPCATAPAAPILRGIYALSEGRSSHGPEFEELALPDAMRVCENEAYRPGLHAVMGRRPELFVKTAETLSRVGVFRFIRPDGFDRMAETVLALLAHWRALDPVKAP